MLAEDKKRRYEFDREMNSYLSRRKRDDSFSAVKATRPAPVTQSPEEVQKMESEYAEEKKGFFDSIMGLFGSGRTETADELDKDMAAAPDERTEDLKEIAKIGLRAMKRLPADEMQEFKQSADFSRFKDLLRKYGMLKEQ